MLPGLSPIAAAAASRGIVPAYIGYTSSIESSTVTLPAIVKAGDVLILFDYVSGGGAGPPSAHVPTGWTSIASYTGGDGRLASSYKIAAGTEGGSSITGITHDDHSAKAVLQFRSAKKITGLTVAGAVGEMNSGGNPSVKTIAASGGVRPVLGLAAFSAVDYSSFTPRTCSITPDDEILIADSNSGNRIALYIQRYLQQGAPANYTFDMDDESDLNGLLGFYMHTFA
jgi:hypothetical protein